MIYAFDMERGFIQFIIILALLVIIISLLGVSLGNVLENQTLKDNFGLIFKGLRWLWDNFLARPAQIFWDFFLRYVWDAFSGILDGIKRGVNVNPFQGQ